MRYAIISDIHSNLEAFESVIKAIEKQRIDKCLFLGDIVGYGANPTECIRELKKMDCLLVAGNHDWGTVELTSLEYFNSYAREAIEWTKERLSEKDKDFIHSLPLFERIGNITIVHSTLENPEEWNYIYSTFQAHRNIELQETPLLFIGHSHLPIFFFENLKEDEPIQYTIEEKIEIKEGYKYIINVGSVGQPRDGNPKASYAIYDDEKNFVEINRIEYDVKKAKEKILEAGLPQILGERLEHGE